MEAASGRTAAEFFALAMDPSREIRTYDFASIRVTLHAAADFHRTAREILAAFEPVTRHTLLHVTLFISTSEALFEAADAEYQRVAAGRSERTGTGIGLIRGGLVARQEIPTSVRSSGDAAYCLAVVALRTRTACLLFHPRSEEVKHTFLRASLASLLCQSRTYHCTHGGAVALDGKGVLLLGPKGSGKTTTLLGLHTAGFTVLSDNLSFLRDGRIVPFFLMGDPKLNVGPDAYALIAPRIPDGDRARDDWNDDGRQLLDVQDVVRAERGAHVPLGCVLMPTLSSAFSIERASPDDVMRTYRDELLRPELELFARHFKVAWFYRWKTRRYWARQLRLVPAFRVALDRSDLRGSIEAASRFVRGALAASAGSAQPAR